MKSKKPKFIENIEEKKATVYYWYSDWSEVTGLTRGQEIPYSDLAKTVEWVMKCGLYVMLKAYNPDGEGNQGGILFAIDDVPFRQR